MSEFDWIRRLRQIISENHRHTGLNPVVGVGDDAAVLAVPEGQQLVVTTDTLVEGVHFRRAVAPEDLGYKSLAVNLSDLAAMGARPAWFFMALTAPEIKSNWLEPFAQGMAELVSESGILLAGGDTTSGPLTITITALGLVDTGTALVRSGARPGDLVVVSGSLGDASCGWKALKSGRQPGEFLRLALDRPTPRNELGTRLVGVASSCIDISDGLLSDLAHILEASGVGVEIDLGDLPCSEHLLDLEFAERYDHQLSGGDDYELCFTFPPQRQSEINRIQKECGVNLSVIGRVTDTGSFVCRTENGEIYQPHRKGYEHFSSSSESSS